MISGRSWEDKIADMHMAMEEKGVDAMVVTGLDETACKSVFQVHTV